MLSKHHLWQVTNSSVFIAIMPKATTPMLQTIPTRFSGFKDVKSTESWNLPSTLRKVPFAQLSFRKAKRET